MFLVSKLIVYANFQIRVDILEKDVRWFKFFGHSDQICQLHKSKINGPIEKSKETISL